MITRYLRRAFGTKHSDSIRRALEVMQLPLDKPATKEVVKKQFANLSKTLHPDVCKAPGATKTYAEVQAAYKLLVSRLKETEADTKDPQSSNVNYTSSAEDSSDQELRQRQYIKSKMNLKSEEEYIYFIIFGKTYEEDPEAFFLRENAKKRRVYIENVEKIREQKIDAQKFVPNEHHQRIFSGSRSGEGQTGQGSDSSGVAAIAGLGLFAVIALGYLAYTHKETHSDRERVEKTQPKLTDEILEKIQHKTKEVKVAKHTEKVVKTLSKLPENLKKFPKETPPADELLLEYTIWKDIKAYTTFRSKMTPDFEAKIESGEVQVPRSPIDNHLLTNYASIALEAERVLQKIYVDM